MDTDNDLLKLYHQQGQQPKEVASVTKIVAHALYQLGLPAGSFSKVSSLYNYSLPSGIIVFGSDGNTYKLKSSGLAASPVKDIYDDSGIGYQWVKLGGCCG